MAADDHWSRWLTTHRYGGDPARFEYIKRSLFPIRDKILEDAEIEAGNVVLDVGTGDGLLGFAAIPLVGDSGTVIFSDISEAAVEMCRAAHDTECATTTRFIAQPAHKLTDVGTQTVDVVMCRAVLMYDDNRAQSIAEMHRVLKPGGRMSICEPINRILRTARLRHGSLYLFGYDVSPLGTIAEKVLHMYGYTEDIDADVMTNFDETDLMAHCEDAGFQDIQIELHIAVSSNAKFPSFEYMWNSAPNPLYPTLREAVERSLTEAEQRQFVEFVQPLISETAHRRYYAQCYLFARKEAA